jgi:tetratricopeptide (TPR) repeat protein
MLSSNQRSAVASLDTARPVVARLDPARHPDDVAADLIEAWSAVETALRSLLGGSGLAGQALVSEVRQRGMLDYGHAHSLLGFLAARDRASRTDYQPTEMDVDAARSGFQAIEAALGLGIGADTATYQAVRPNGTPVTGLGAPPPMPNAPPRPSYTRNATQANVPPAAASSAAPLDGPDALYKPSTRGQTPLYILAAVLVAILGLGGYLAATQLGEPASLKNGKTAYQQGNRVLARRSFEQAVIDRPKLALPHVYLGRIARDDGDLARANSELRTAITLEPDNALAQREMGQLLIQANNPVLAISFLKRAISANQADRVAQGWMGCALSRQGRPDLAASWFARAGSGDWTACQQTLPNVAVPGSVPGAVQQPAVRGAAVPRP